MKSTKQILFAVLWPFIYTSELLSQTIEAQILAIRKGSNLALKSHKEKIVLLYLTDHVLTTKGNGNLLSGKKH